MTTADLIDKHPAVISFLSLCAVLVAAIGYRTVKLVTDALTGRRQLQAPRRRRAAALATDTRGVPEPQKLRDLRTALADLGYNRREYEPVAATVDLTAPLPEIVRAAIKKLHAARTGASS